MRSSGEPIVMGRNKLKATQNQTFISGLGFTFVVWGVCCRVKQGLLGCSFRVASESVLVSLEFVLTYGAVVEPAFRVWNIELEGLQA